MNKRADKVAIVTGGNAGRGLATAKLFVEEGAYVSIFGRNQDKINRALAEIGHKVAAVRSDSRLRNASPTAVIALGRH